MLERTRRLWEKQHRLVGDRRGLFGAVADAVDVKTVLYPGSYVDMTPSFIWPAVTYVDLDKRANQFLADQGGVDELIVEHGVDRDRHVVRFIHADYSSDVDVD